MELTPVTYKARKRMICDGPTLRLKGHWFTQFGFTSGDQVLITNEAPGVLTIRIHQRRAEVMAIREQIAKAKQVAAIAEKRRQQRALAKERKQQIQQTD